MSQAMPYRLSTDVERAIDTFEARFRRAKRYMEGHRGPEQYAIAHDILTKTVKEAYDDLVRALEEQISD